MEILDSLLILISQTDTATTTATAGDLGEGFYAIFVAFSQGVLQGAGAIGAFLLLVSRFANLEATLAPTPFDWVVWVLRAAGTFVSVGAAALLTSMAGGADLLPAVIGAAGVAIPASLRYITRAITELTD